MADRYAVVTGAGQGIGRAAAQALLADGWTVAVLGRRLAPLEETIAGQERGLALTADVGARDEVEAAFAEVKSRFGRLDLLFNNAGRGAPAVDFDELPFEDWNGVVAANLTGSFLCAQAAYRIMKHQSPRGGRIINNGSISAHAPRPGAAAYTATKHAITGLTKQIVLDGRKHDITASQIDIGNAATPMTERMTKGVMQPDGSMMVEPRMDVALVGRTVAHMASMPLEANIPFLTIMATKMPWLGRG
ncbi:SDR family oxidoreductase [Muricoccus pecuniae]|uniref:NAD(P)-dependent dehydrogenase (Short-subunit alcohol dehydrogenase family) n=1 Tax=Muricoccus pecuniae TaxID=693023 RepID=A0A840YBI0_9PROT|nr:SDR family oxidoreductase [Roseomonas pecuniae]MBB5693717.1 NAD(P)-dependent dehydrogenase (short-subunit alcohol dehydrogenase family) [Roseomonas pecuniae]